MANSSLSNVLYRTGWLELTGEVRNRLPLTGCSLLKDIPDRYIGCVGHNGQCSVWLGVSKECGTS